MLWSAIVLVLLGGVEVGTSGSPPTTVSIPESPSPGLALEVAPTLVDGLADATAPAPPVPTGPGGYPTIATIVAGLAVLAARARRISRARTIIRDSLQDNLFSDVGHADLSAITHTMSSLDPGEATAVVGSLSDHELDVWMRELDGWRGGFNSDEEARLFDVLAARLDARQLSRLIASGKPTEAMAAAGTGAPDDVRVKLALLLLEDRNPTDRGWDEILFLIEGAPGGVVETVVRAVPLQPLAVSLLGIHAARPDEGSRRRLDALLRFLRVAAGFNDAGLKARLFLEIGEQLRRHRDLPDTGDASDEDVLGGLASLLRSDAPGVLTELNHVADPHGNLLSAWIQDMIDADRFDELDVLFTELAGAGDRVAFFSHPGNDPARPYPNAANLGYFVGAYSLAIDAIADDAEEQIDLVGRLFSILTGVVPGPDGSKIRLPFSPLVDVHADAVIDGFRAQATSLKQTLWGLAKPRTPDGLLWNGAGISQFQDAWEEVVAVR